MSGKLNTLDSQPNHMLKVLFLIFLIAIFSSNSYSQDIAYKDSIDALFKKIKTKHTRDKDTAKRVPNSFVYWFKKGSGELIGALTASKAQECQTKYYFHEGRLVRVWMAELCGEKRKRSCYSEYYFRNSVLVHQQGSRIIGADEIAVLIMVAEQLAARGKELSVKM